MGSKFDDSVKRIKRERFRELSTQYGEWPGEDAERLFNESIGVLKSRRDAKYIEELQKRYSPEWIAKVFEYMRELSPMEINNHKTFEDLCVSFIEAHKENPDRVSVAEISQFFDASGNAKRIVEPPDERKLDLNNLELDEDGVLWEKPPAPKMKVQPKIPELHEARRMTSDELAAILPKGD